MQKLICRDLFSVNPGYLTRLLSSADRVTDPSTRVGLATTLQLQLLCDASQPNPLISNIFERVILCDHLLPQQPQLTQGLCSCQLYHTPWFKNMFHTQINELLCRIKESSCRE